MVYGILKFINFAHSDIVVLGAWTSYTLASKILQSWIESTQSGKAFRRSGSQPLCLAAMVFCGAVGFAIERLAYRQLNARLMLITAIGVSLFLQNVGQLDFVFGASPGDASSKLGTGFVHIWRRRNSSPGDRAGGCGDLFDRHVSDADDAVPRLSHKAGRGDAAVSFNTNAQH